MSDGKSIGELAYIRKRRGSNLIHYNPFKSGNCKISIPVTIAKEANIEAGTKALIMWDEGTAQFTIRLVTDHDDLKYAYTARCNNTEGLWRIYFTFKHYSRLKMPTQRYRVERYSIQKGIRFRLDPQDIIKPNERGGRKVPKNATT